ncbi:MAG: ATP-binding protein [Parabacteroides sp.]|nr:ATP-binding protein [Parabacteroides sp.]
MDAYENYSKEDLIRRINELETNLAHCLENNLQAESVDNYLADQRKINFLNILMDTILSNVFVAICVKDIFDGFKYIYFNQAAENFTGIEASEVIGKTDFELFADPRRAHEIRTEDYSTIKNGRTKKSMIEYEKPNGDIRIVNCVRLLITNPDPGASPLLLVMLWDVTEQRQNELDLMKAQETDKMKNAFIANMSHEIRTPLNAIVGFSRLITETDNDSEQQEYLTIIENNSDLLLQLINDILDFAKIESGTLNYSVSWIDLKDICHEVYVSQSLRMTSDIALLFNGDMLPSIRLQTDVQRIEQVLLNLLSNAIKCTNQGFVSLSYELEGDFVKVSVTDTGIGIAKDKQEAVFERFVKLDEFRQGTGLGLSICKMIIEKLGGQIGVISELGKGSTFWFTLPLSCPLAFPSEKRDDILSDNIPDVLPGQYTILIAEDVLENYLLLQAVLKQQYRLVYAENGRQAVQMFKDYKPDLVLMDIKMPIMDGFAATCEIRKLSSEIPVLALSAFTFDEEKEKARCCKFNEYLVKPVDIPLLKYKIKYYLNKNKKK